MHCSRRYVALGEEAADELGLVLHHAPFPLSFFRSASSACHYWAASRIMFSSSANWDLGFPPFWR
jgi:hypothetical protein